VARDSTEQIDIQTTSVEFFRRELYIGPVRSVTFPDSGRSEDTATTRFRRLRMGDGHLSGTVVTPDGRPLSGARVGIPEGPQTRTNDRGHWTLADTPLGTRILEVRAISYYPERRAVDVAADTPPVRVVLSTLEAVLDTVRVTAARLADHGSGFEDRRRNSALGRFLTREDIAKRAVSQTSELFRTIRGSTSRPRS
jgi:hypothetical protein